MLYDSDIIFFNEEDRFIGFKFENFLIQGCGLTQMLKNNTCVCVKCEMQDGEAKIQHNKKGQSDCCN